MATRLEDIDFFIEHIEDDLRDKYDNGECDYDMNKTEKEVYELLCDLFYKLEDPEEDIAFISNEDAGQIQKIWSKYLTKIHNRYLKKYYINAIDLLYDKESIEESTYYPQIMEEDNTVIKGGTR